MMNPLTFMPCITAETCRGLERYPIGDALFQRREVQCVGEIDPAAAYALTAQLRYLQHLDPQEEITLFINSPGGEVSSGLAIYDVMNAVTCPVRTVCVGLAASMGAILFAAGDKRDILPHARVMIHGPALSGGGGPALAVERISKDLMKTRRTTAEILAKHTGRTVKEILKKTAADTYFAAMRYKFYMTCVHADRMYASIMGILAEKLSPLTFDGARALYQNPDKIDIYGLGQRKTAVFLNISDTDRSMDKLANLFYTQALHVLCRTADKSEGHRLPVPVRFLLDDFASNVCIPDFDKIVSVIRSREISVSLILQSISQLESLYGPARARTIINNCDHCLYLGSQDVDTARYIAVKANKNINTVLDMPVGEAWLFARGQAPRKVRRYDVERHALYAEGLGR